MAKQRPAQDTSPRSGRFTEVLLTLAIGLAALAVGAGLYLRAGFGPMPAVIVAASFFLVVASSQLALARTRAMSGSLARMRAFETDMARVADAVGRVDAFAERCELFDADGGTTAALEQAVSDLRQAADGLGARQKEIETGAAAQSARIAQLEHGAAGDVTARLEALDARIGTEGREHRDAVRAELQMLETLIKQLVEEMAARGMKPKVSLDGMGAATAPAVPDEAALDAAFDGLEADEAGAPAPYGDAAGDDADPLPAIDPHEVDSQLLTLVRQSIEANKIELHLQPIMTLPARKIRYYEALTRLKSPGGDTLMPDDYMGIAEHGGLMPLIDNLMLYRAVQILKRLETRASNRGVFCNISVHSLLDAEFFPEFIALMEQNQSLAGALVFEFGQDMLSGFGPMEFESLERLADLGFRFSVDHVENLDIDFEALHDKAFRFVKIDADIFVNRMDETGARIHPADMRKYLARFGLELVVEKIEDDATLATLLDYDIGLGQGYLFAEPRPVRAEVFGASQAA